MALVMNDTDMKRMLEELCPEGETYTAVSYTHLTLPTTPYV